MTGERHGEDINCQPTLLSLRSYLSLPSSHTIISGSLTRDGVGRNGDVDGFVGLFSHPIISFPYLFPSLSLTSVPHPPFKRLWKRKEGEMKEEVIGSEENGDERSERVWGDVCLLVHTFHLFSPSLFHPSFHSGSFVGEVRKETA